MQKSTDETVRSCEQMTALLIAAVTEAQKAQEKYQALMAEYQKRLDVYQRGLAQYRTLCTGSCVNGGVVEHGCNPVCTNWLRVNPMPIEPAPLVLPNFGTFICQVCSQRVDMNALAGGDVRMAQNAIQQLQTCTINLAQEASAAKDDKPVVITGQDVIGDKTIASGTIKNTQTAQSTQSTQSAQSTRATLWIIIAIIVITAIFIAVVLVLIMTDDDGEYEPDDERA